MQNINWTAIKRREELEKVWGVSLTFREEDGSIIYFNQMTGTIYATEPHTK